jgi:hypothetical protein
MNRRQDDVKSSRNLIIIIISIDVMHKSSHRRRQIEYDFNNVNIFQY